MQRMPPYSEEAEQGVLGSVLLDAERVLDLAVENGLRPESFHVPNHRTIFQALMDMWRDGRPVDMLTVSEKLKAKSALDRVGGAIFIDRLVDATPTAAHAEYYMDIVMQKELLRRTIKCARAMEDDCYQDDDAFSVVARAEQSVFSLCDEDAGTRPWADTVRDNATRIDNIISGSGSFMGIPSGYHNIDNILLGFKECEMTIIAARPSMGKTALALNIAERIAMGQTTDHAPRPVGVFSLEMSADSLVLRMLCSHSRVPSHALTRGIIATAQHGRIRQAAQILAKAPIYVDDTGGLEVEGLRARARRLCKKQGIEIIFIDYMQLVRIKGYEHRSRNEEVSAVSASLKAMAKELKIPVVVLSQLSRAPENDGQRKPRMSDLRDSGAIEQDADVVCLLRRPCKLARDDENDDETLAVVEVAKHRNGPTGDIRLNFEDQYTRFEDRSRGVDPNDPMAQITEDERHGVPVPA